MNAALWPYGKCKKCTNKNYCGWSNAEIANCMNNDYRNFSPETNADHVRSMADEELAEFFHYKDCPSVEMMLLCPTEADHDCYNCWLNWLRQEVSDAL